MPLTSVAGQIQERIRDVVRTILPTLDPAQIQVRPNFYVGDVICRGISIHKLAEQYDDGTIGTHDVNHVIAVTACQQEDNNAILSNDSIDVWIQTIRREFVDDRLATLSASVPQHVIKLAPGNPRVPKKQFPNWGALQIVLNVWTRELPT
jgi:hypothetical protein